MLAGNDKQMYVTRKSDRLLIFLIKREERLVRKPSLLHQPAREVESA